MTGNLESPFAKAFVKAKEGIEADQKRIAEIESKKKTEVELSNDKWRSIISEIMPEVIGRAKTDIDDLGGKIETKTSEKSYTFQVRLPSQGRSGAEYTLSRTGDHYFLTSRKINIDGKWNEQDWSNKFGSTNMKDFDKARAEKLLVHAIDSANPASPRSPFD